MRVDDGKGHVFHYDIFTPNHNGAAEGIGLNDVCVIESVKPRVNLPLDKFYVKIATYVPQRSNQLQTAFIKGQINPLPPELTADSEPNTDEWGPDNYWGPGTYITWHQLNKQAYGKAVADSKMVNAIQQWGTGGVEFDYCYNDNFRNYFTAQGIDVSTLFCHVVNTATNITDVAESLTEGASSTADMLAALAPYVSIGAGLIAAYIGLKKEEI